MFSELQFDALTEIFNVGCGRAASSLSEIVGDTIHLSVPSIEVLKKKELDTTVFDFGNEEIATVSQTFTGPLEAEGVLLFRETQALNIAREMMGSQVSLEDLPDFEQEALCEVGNIILNACLSAMADILDLELNSGLPRYALAPPRWIFSYMEDERIEDCLIVLHIKFLIEKRQSEGNLIFFLSTLSLTRLAERIEKYLNTLS